MSRTINAITAGAGIALAALLIPALGAGASTIHSANERVPAKPTTSSGSSAGVTVVHNAASEQYSWATGFDSGKTGPSWLQENFLIQTQSLTDRTGSTEDNHSLTETFVRDAAGDAFEFGVTTDAQGATTKPTLFTTSWTAGHFNGYQAGFVSTTSVKPGSFNPPVGTSPEFGYSISGGKIWFSYGGKNFGYIPTSYWKSGFGAVTGTQTYGEVFDNSPGGTVTPTMTGRVSNYQTSTGSHLTSFSISYPYKIPSASGTGFTFGS